MLQSIGADHVIDYTKENFRENSEQYDVIFDLVASSSILRSSKSLKKNGRYILANPKILPMFQGLWISWTSDKNVIIEMAGESTKDLIEIRELMESGKIKPVIDKRFRLEEMADAHRYVESGQKKGNIVITI